MQKNTQFAKKYTADLQKEWVSGQKNIPQKTKRSEWVGLQSFPEKQKYTTPLIGGILKVLVKYDFLGWKFSAETRGGELVWYLDQTAKMG